MTLSEQVSGSFAPQPAVGGDAAHARILAAAFAHLLARDDDRPARWVTEAFETAVEARRAELRPCMTLTELPVPGRDAGQDVSFEASVARLAGHPGDIALAIRSLEIAGLRRLPAWGELVRRGLPRRPSELDSALWFG